MSSREQDTGLHKSEHRLRTSNTPREVTEPWPRSQGTAPRWPNASLEGWSDNAGMPQFGERHRLHKLKVWGNLASSKSTDPPLPVTFAHCMSLCHILVILAVFQNFCLTS